MNFGLNYKYLHNLCVEQFVFVITQPDKTSMILIVSDMNNIELVNFMIPSVQH